MIAYGPLRKFSVVLNILHYMLHLFMVILQPEVRSNLIGNRCNVQFCAFCQYFIGLSPEWKLMIVFNTDGDLIKFILKKFALAVVIILS